MTKKKINRKDFIVKSGIAATAAIIGSKIIFAKNLPEGLDPISADANIFRHAMPGKDERLKILNDKPWNAETPPHLLETMVFRQKTQIQTIGP